MIFIGVPRRGSTCQDKLNNRGMDRRGRKRMTTHRKDPPQQPVVVMAAVHRPNGSSTLLVFGLALVRALVRLSVALVLLREVQHRLQGCSDEASVGPDASPDTGADVISWPRYL